MVKRGTTIVAATLIAMQSVAAVAAPVGNGIASNRVALGMPVAERTCTTVDGRASCTTDGPSKLAGGASVVVLIAALAAVAAGIVVVAKEDRSPNSP